MTLLLITMFQNYRIGSIHRTLTQDIGDGKIYFGEVGREFNYYQRDLQELSNMHRELTLLYGPIYSYSNYEKISSIGSNNIFNMFVDFSVFFENLYDNYSDSIVAEGEELYLSLNKLKDEERNGIEIMALITGGLEKIRSESYANKTSDDKKALKDYLIKSAEYFNTQEVQDKIDVIENLNKNDFHQ
ncbi:hypothetical protein [Paenibacillus humicola]|uniref:hypothetical protein n=1 Tax=Paenibacillus humicola TaxID=3110540 RepID=UPI00237B6C20|nr:hypothetical protein [Paenibacillus humicola]